MSVEALFQKTISFKWRPRLVLSVCFRDHCWVAYFREIDSAIFRKCLLPLVVATGRGIDYRTGCVTAGRPTEPPARDPLLPPRVIHYHIFRGSSMAQF